MTFGGKMNYVAMPSLEHIALVKTTTTLWIQDDISSCLCNLPWREENKILSKVPELLLPKCLENKVLNFVETIGLGILKWKEFHDFFLPETRLHREILSKLYWTPQGTVDKKKTAEMLIKYENLDITHRYKLACIYCLENDILTLWNKIPESNRERFYSVADPRCVRQPELVVYWTYYIKGEVAKVDDWVKKRGFKGAPTYFVVKSATSGNKVATEYFLHKLTALEREESLVKCAGTIARRSCNDHHCLKNTNIPKVDYADVLCFLLSQMHEEQQNELFWRYSFQILKCLLHWPWQSFFMETAIRMWEILPQKDFFDLLRYIVKFKNRHKDYDYQKLFKQFWLQSPTTHKEYVIMLKYDCPSLITDLIDIEAPELVKLILEFANTAEREKIILSDEMKSSCRRLIYDRKLGKLKLFVQQCLLSKDMLVKFKEMMKKLNDEIMRDGQEILLMFYCQFKITRHEEKRSWTELFQLLDDLIQKLDKKRSLEDVNSGKRHCSSTSE